MLSFNISKKPLGKLFSRLTTQTKLSDRVNCTCKCTIFAAHCRNNKVLWRSRANNSHLKRQITAPWQLIASPEQQMTTMSTNELWHENANSYKISRFRHEAKYLHHYKGGLIVKQACFTIPFSNDFSPTWPQICCLNRLVKKSAANLFSFSFPGYGATSLPTGEG